ncbi:unnamed protein product [Ostreobium quekettii]|uniref:LsmAD domain-containing protein n=1 Tax=Ostreobium quekettii TaxID=121088 RepID=A0A8S1IV48_9CHLO|nr:unnamed protein product [Ostreobium quekettii]
MLGTKNLNIILKRAKRIKNGRTEEDGELQAKLPETMIISANDFVQLRALNVPCGEHVVGSSSAENGIASKARNGFQSDSSAEVPLAVHRCEEHSDVMQGGDAQGDDAVEDAFLGDRIRAHRRPGIHGRQLKKWVPVPEGIPDDAGIEDLAYGCGIGGRDTGWDQFRVNKEKFGVDTTFDESIYTSRLDESKSRYSRADAERIAQEIQSEKTKSTHVALERGLDLENEEGEEALHSAVLNNDAEGLDGPPVSGAQAAPSSFPTSLFPPLQASATKSPNHKAGNGVSPARERIATETTKDGRFQSPATETARQAEPKPAPVTKTSYADILMGRQGTEGSAASPKREPSQMHKQDAAHDRDRAAPKTLMTSQTTLAHSFDAAMEQTGMQQKGPWGRGRGMPKEMNPSHPQRPTGNSAELGGAQKVTWGRGHMVMKLAAGAPLAVGARTSKKAEVEAAVYGSSAVHPKLGNTTQRILPTSVSPNQGGTEFVGPTEMKGIMVTKQAVEDHPLGKGPFGADANKVMEDVIPEAAKGPAAEAPKAALSKADDGPQSLASSPSEGSSPGTRSPTSDLQTPPMENPGCSSAATAQTSPNVVNVPNGPASSPFARSRSAVQPGISYLAKLQMGRQPAVQQPSAHELQTSARSSQASAQQLVTREQELGLQSPPALQKSVEDAAAPRPGKSDGLTGSKASSISKAPVGRNGDIAINSKMTQTTNDLGTKARASKVDSGTSTSLDIGQLSVDGPGLPANSSLLVQPTALTSTELGAATKVEQKPRKDKFTRGRAQGPGDAAHHPAVQPSSMPDASDPVPGGPEQQQCYDRSYQQNTAQVQQQKTRLNPNAQPFKPAPGTFPSYHPMPTPYEVRPSMETYTVLSLAQMHHMSQMAQMGVPRNAQWGPNNASPGGPAPGRSNSGSRGHQPEQNGNTGPNVVTPWPTFPGTGVWHSEEQMHSGAMLSGYGMPGGFPVFMGPAGSYVGAPQDARMWGSHAGSGGPYRGMPPPNGATLLGSAYMHPPVVRWRPKGRSGHSGSRSCTSSSGGLLRVQHRSANRGNDGITRASKASA